MTRVAIDMTIEDHVITETVNVITDALLLLMIVMLLQEATTIDTDHHQAVMIDTLQENTTDMHHHQEITLLQITIVTESTEIIHHENILEVLITTEEITTDLLMMPTHQEMSVTDHLPLLQEIEAHHRHIIIHNTHHHLEIADTRTQGGVTHVRVAVMVDTNQMILILPHLRIRTDQNLNQERAVTSSAPTCRVTVLTDHLKEAPTAPEVLPMNPVHTDHRHLQPHHPLLTLLLTHVIKKLVGS